MCVYYKDFIYILITFQSIAFNKLQYLVIMLGEKWEGRGILLYFLKCVRVCVFGDRVSRSLSVNFHTSWSSIILLHGASAEIIGVY